MLTPRVCPLQRSAHGDGDWNGIASVRCTTHKIPLWARSDVTGKAISSKPINDRREAARAKCVNPPGTRQAQKIPSRASPR